MISFFGLVVGVVLVDTSDFECEMANDSREERCEDVVVRVGLGDKNGYEVVEDGKRDSDDNKFSEKERGENGHGSLGLGKDKNTGKLSLNYLFGGKISGVVDGLEVEMVFHV